MVKFAGNHYKLVRRNSRKCKVKKSGICDILNQYRLCTTGQTVGKKNLPIKLAVGVFQYLKKEYCLNEAKPSQENLSSYGA